MKRNLVFVIVLLFAISLLGCSPSKDKKPEGEPGIIGYVTAIENGRILVISTEAQDFSANGGVNEFYDAIWFSNVPKDIKLGDRVRVWYDMVAESYPGQSEALHVELFPRVKPEAANLTESDALHRALTSEELTTKENTVVIKKIEYNLDYDQWEILLKSLWDDKTYDINIEDK